METKIAVNGSEKKGFPLYRKITKKNNDADIYIQLANLAEKAKTLKVAPYNLQQLYKNEFKSKVCNICNIRVASYADFFQHTFGGGHLRALQSLQITPDELTFWSNIIGTAQNNVVKLDCTTQVIINKPLPFYHKNSVNEALPKSLLEDLLDPLLSYTSKFASGQYTVTSKMEEIFKSRRLTNCLLCNKKISPIANFYTHTFSNGHILSVKSTLNCSLNDLKFWYACFNLNMSPFNMVKERSYNHIGQAPVAEKETCHLVDSYQSEVVTPVTNGFREQQKINLNERLVPYNLRDSFKPRIEQYSSFNEEKPRNMNIEIPLLSPSTSLSDSRPNSRLSYEKIRFLMNDLHSIFRRVDHVLLEKNHPIRPQYCELCNCNLDGVYSIIRHIVCTYHTINLACLGNPTEDDFFFWQSILKGVIRNY